MPDAPKWSIALVVGLVVACLAGCGNSSTEQKGGAQFGLERVTPETVLPGTRLQVLGSGFRKDDSFTVRLEGEIDGRSVSFTRAATFEATDRVSTSLDDAFFEAVGTKEGTFSGDVALTVDRGDRSGTRETAIRLQLTESLEPNVR